MNLIKDYAFVVCFNLITIAVAWFFLSNQLDSHHAEITSIIARPPLSEIEKSKLEPVPEAVTSVKEAPKAVLIPVSKTVQIPIYTKGDGSGKIFTTFKDRDELVIVRSSDEWGEVISPSGFPAWVRGDLVESFSKGYVSVIVNVANARTSPSTKNSVTLGRLQRGDVLKVNKKQGEWIRVWTPIKFKGWVKMSDYK